MISLQVAQNNTVTVQKLVNYHLGAHSFLGKENSRNTVSRCTKCKTYTKTQVTSEFTKTPSILVLSLTSMTQEQMIAFYTKATIHNQFAKKQLYIHEKNFKENPKMEMSPQELGTELNSTPGTLPQYESG